MNSILLKSFSWHCKGARLLIKGLMLLIDAIELLMQEDQNNLYFFIRGKMDGSEYSRLCETALNDLILRFPENVNGDISRFVPDKSDSLEDNTIYHSP